MQRYEAPTPEEWARIIGIQDSLIELYVEHKEAVEKGSVTRAKWIEAEIRVLLKEKENVENWAAV